MSFDDTYSSDPLGTDPAALAYQKQLPVQGQPAPTSYIIEPDLVETQTGKMHLPPDVAFDDVGTPYNTITGKPIKVVRRPNVLPIAMTPDGPTFAMPKLLDAFSNVMSPLAAGRVPIKAGEMVLGSGAVRTAAEADAPLTIYRGEYSGNKGGKFWSPDPEFAVQFTQTGQHKELLKKTIKPSEIYKADHIYAGDPDAVDAALAQAKAKGFKAVELNEGQGQPNSIRFLSDTSPQVAGAVGHTIEKANQPFYSSLERAVETAKMGKGDAQQWLGYLKNQPGVKSDEIATVLKELPEGPISKEALSNIVKDNKVELGEVVKGAELVQHIENKILNRQPLTAEDKAFMDQAATKYHGYQLPGGENYKEMLLTLPEKPVSGYRVRAASDMGGGYEVINAVGDRVHMAPRQSDAMDWIKTGGSESYRSSHWDEPNVVAHIRHNDRNVPIEFTPQEKAALDAHSAAEPKLNELRRAQGEIGNQISEISKPLEQARRAQILKDLKDGKISNGDAQRALENYESPIDLKPYQDKLETLRKQESDLRNSLPEKPIQQNEKTLHIEEVQSDWHQAGRKQGYKLSEKQKSDLDNIENKLTSKLTEAEIGNPDIDNVLKVAVDKKVISADDAKNYKEYAKGENSNVPDAPFKKNWDELALKRMMHKAANEGYDAISWTPGEAQAARYDLSKTFKNITAHRNADGTFEVTAMDMKNNQPHNFGSSISKEKMVDFVGKDLAEKIVAQEGRSTKKYEGSELKIGGEGMKSFYDKMLVDKANALAKKYGTKVEQREIPLDTKKPTDFKDFADWEKAKAEGRKQPIHYLPITPELRARAKQGFPLFSSTPILNPVDFDPFQTNKKYKLVPIEGNPFQ